LETRGFIGCGWPVNGLSLECRVRVWFGWKVCLVVIGSSTDVSAGEFVHGVWMADRTFFLSSAIVAEGNVLQEERHDTLRYGMVWYGMVW
jgi:hypothetical protein